MIFFVVPLILLAWKKEPILPIFRVADLYPLFFTELVHLFFQINFFFGNTTYVKFASVIRVAFILVLLLPILRRKLYVQALVGSGLTFVGTLMNEFVIRANEGHMPVLATLSKWTGYMKPGQLSGSIDSLHILMTNQTSLNFLGDTIDVGFCILSPGDLLIHSFISIIIFYTIRTFNKTKG